MTKLDLVTCTQCIERRTILKGGIAGAIAAVIPVACGGNPLKVDVPDGNVVDGAAGGSGGGGGTVGACPRAVAAGNGGALAVGGLMVVGNMVLGRDAGGLYAMSAICTHQGCLVTVVNAAPQSSLLCPCHGSTFTATGAVTRGPAGTALQHFQVDVAADGAVTICPGDPVLSTTRTPV